MLKVRWEHPQKYLYDENGFIKLDQEIAEVFLIHRKCTEETEKGGLLLLQPSLLF